MYVQRNTETRSQTVVAMEKRTYGVCVVCVLALVIRHENRVFSASYDIVIRAVYSSTAYSHIVS
jgi:hypothetical protein